MERMTKDYKFKSFLEAMNFVEGVARIAESKDHHPDILIKYNQVTLTFYTHTENSVTEKDLRLAAEIEDYFKSTMSGASKI